MRPLFAFCPSPLAADSPLLAFLQAGTVFMNRCDALDPALAWTGVKDSGRGVSLSSFGAALPTFLLSPDRSSNRAFLLRL